MNIKIGKDAEIVKCADKLRRIVFIDEQGIPEEEIFDGLNAKAIHFVIFDDESAVATARVLRDGYDWHIGLVAVDKSMRGKHFGDKVMHAAIEYIISSGGKEIFLSAQKQACKFYEKLNFVQCGEIQVFESGFVLVPMKYCHKP